MLSIITELISLSKNKILEMETVKNWLGKHQDYYERIKRVNSVFHLYESEDEVIRLPDFSEKDKYDEQFLTVFEKLKELKKHHSLEIYYEDQLDFLATILEDDNRLKVFYECNIKFYENEIFSFHIDYTEDDISSNSVGITLHSPKHQIQINPENFKHTFKFSQEFEQQFLNN